MIDNVTDKKYSSQVRVGEIICNLDIKVYFKKIGSLNMNQKGGKRIRPHNMQFTSQILNPLYNELD